MNVHRRAVLASLVGIPVAGCLSSLPTSDDTPGTTRVIVASPHDSPPESGAVTEIDDTEIEDVELIQEVVPQALQENKTVSKRIQDEEKYDEVTGVIVSLPEYEGDDTYNTGTYIRKDSKAVQIYTEHYGV